MRITALELACRDLKAQQHFYAGVLGLTLVASSDSGFAVQVGRTRLSFRLQPEQPGVYHFAFNIPENQLAQAKSWIQQRAALLNEDGQDEFEASAAWNAQMIYFCDPDGNILECIARHRLANASAQAFGPASLLNISEIGWPVKTVPGGVEHLQQQLGLSVFGTASDTFTPLGDDEGLLIVVRLGRPWFPTAQAAARLPLRLTLAEVAGDLELDWDAAPKGAT
ncbi:VOC family protein [Deinococcus alpinitundrae]|uniref:VOC family protein n=1 Tax=Deinococcus alpinitundrae TaxID=468913 RepID=UPI001379F92D|nr:VOC family protein [Deinococcus alpinitundrae]